MSLNIKNEETEALARRLAGETGESITHAVTVALEERLERLKRGSARARDERRAALLELAEDAGRRWSEPYRSVDHAELLYDDAGLPR